jgi:hypothetical protein
MKSGQYDKMNISLKQPSKVSFSTGRTSNKTSKPSRFRQPVQQTRKQATSNAFVTLLFIVLFVFFSGMVVSITPPASAEEVGTPALAVDYLKQEAPIIGEVAFDSIMIVAGFLVALTKPVEFIVTNIAIVTDAYFSFFGIFNWSFQQELGETYIAYDDLPFPTRVWIANITIIYNLFQNDGPNLTSEQYWAFEQFRSQQIIYPCDLFDSSHTEIDQLDYVGVCS